METMMEYRMSIETELLALKGEDGLIHVETVRAWALQNQDSELYSAIDWDLERGAVQWQLHQIRRIIKVHIRFDDASPRVVNLKADRISGGGYRLVDDVIPVVDLRQQMLNDVLAEIEKLKAKYSILSEMCSVWDAAEEVRNSQDKPRKRAGRR